MTIAFQASTCVGLCAGEVAGMQRPRQSVGLSPHRSDGNLKHIQKLGSPCTIHVITRSGKEIEIWADEIDQPSNELGLVRFKLAGEVVGLVLANQFAGWWTSVPNSN